MSTCIESKLITTIIGSEEVEEGTRVRVMIEINHWERKGKEGRHSEGLRYEMLCIRKLAENEEKEKKRKYIASISANKEMQDIFVERNLA